MEKSSRLFFKPGGAISTREAVPVGQRALVSDWVHRDLELARITRANLLLIGAEGLVAYLMKFLIRDLNQALVIDCRADRFPLPPPSSLLATMVLRNVDALSNERQLTLLEWLRSASGLTQVVCTSSAPLLSLLKTATFSEALYYHLNTVCIDLSEWLASPSIFDDI